MGSFLKDDLVDYCVNNGLELQEHQGDQGIYYTACCPMHHDQNPSFVVYPNTGPQTARWICLSGCGSGDIIDLAVAWKGLTKREAIKSTTVKVDSRDMLIANLKAGKTEEVDLLEISIRMHSLFKRLKLAKSMSLFQKLDALLAEGKLYEVDQLLEAHNV